MDIACDGGNVFVLRTAHVDRVNDSAESAVVGQARNQSVFLGVSNRLIDPREHNRGI